MGASLHSVKLRHKVNHTKSSYRRNKCKLMKQSFIGKIDDLFVGGSHIPESLDRVINKKPGMFLQSVYSILKTCVTCNVTDMKEVK